MHDNGMHVELHMTGTKIGCGEGGCGACTVILTWHDATEDKQVTKSVNGCLYPLCAADGKVISARYINYSSPMYARMVPNCSVRHFSHICEVR